MNDIETRLSAALHAEADDLSARVDLPAAAAQLETRLDRLAGAHRRRTWMLGLAAAAAVVAALAVSVLLNAARHDSAPISPSTSYTTSLFVVPLTADVPDWAAARAPVPVAGHLVLWQQDQCWTSCTAGRDAKLLLFAPQVAFGPAATDRLVIPSSAGYLAHLEALQAAHLVTLSGSHTITVDGHAATVLDVETTAAAPGALGCAGSGAVGPDEGCWSFAAGTHVRIAVIDADTQPYYELGAVSPPLLALVRVNAGNDKQATYDADLDHLLATLRIPAPPTPTYTSTASALPFSIVLPSWATSVTPVEAASGRLATWEVSCRPTTADCAHPSLQFGIVRPTPAAPGAADPFDAIATGVAPGVTIVGDVTNPYVARHNANVLTVTATKDVPGAFGCAAPGLCPGLAAGTTTRIAVVIEQAKPAVIIWQSWTTGAPGTDGLAADFDKALASMRLGA